MKFEQNKGHRRISGKGVLVLLQDGHVFAGKDKYVGPEPKGSGSMTTAQILEAAKGGPKKVEKVKQEVFKKVERPVLSLGTKKRKRTRRVIGRK